MTRPWRAALGLFLAALLFLFVAPQAARADVSRPVGWSLASATSQVHVGRVTLRYDPRLQDEALAVAREIPRAWSEIEHALAGDLEDALTIHFVAHSGRIAEGTGMPQWAAGVAHPPTGEIAIAAHAPDGSLTDLDGLLRHEMAHVALFRATGGEPLPRWFHEGVAESFGEEIDLMRSQTLAGAIFGAGVPRLEQLEQNFRSTDAITATVSYAAARDFVNFLRWHDENGSDMRQALAQIKQGKGFEAAFQSGFGRSLAELDTDWRGGLTGRFMWFPIVSGDGLPMALAFPLVFVAAIRRRRHVREGWARLEAEDAALRAPVAA
ncbi:peptidase MA family metallohydrolase [Nannocystis bainbridge]|uniref:Peptidase MA family metallohydrolase n=1 Tax=Nannocystis bainbridge TaxID=2995303 RepID=A0ABT5DQP3_9BACT|nr:peptidase MA family metallohydrolase [Nannocystis bainbridge]MDC0715975.1 peptidase MA family metallohydrolase [Nannocystis bainbridge]